MTFPREVALMHALASPGSVGTSAAVSLVDWLKLDDELILVMERPDPCIDLCNYCLERGGNLKEDEAAVSRSKELKRTKHFSLGGICPQLVCCQSGLNLTFRLFSLRSS